MQPAKASAALSSLAVVVEVRMLKDCCVFFCLQFSEFSGSRTCPGDRCGVMQVACWPSFSWREGERVGRSEGGREGEHGWKEGGRET